MIFCYLLELWDILPAIKHYRNYIAVGGVCVTSDLSPNPVLLCNIPVGLPRHSRKWNKYINHTVTADISSSACFVFHLRNCLRKWCQGNLLPEAAAQWYCRCAHLSLPFAWPSCHLPPPLKTGGSCAQLQSILATRKEKHFNLIEYRILRQLPLFGFATFCCNSQRV